MAKKKKTKKAKKAKKTKITKIKIKNKSKSEIKLLIRKHQVQGSMKNQK